MFCQLLLHHLLLYSQQILLHLAQCLHLILHPVHHLVHHTMLLHLQVLHLLIGELILQSLPSKGQGSMHLSIQTTPGGPSDITLHNGGRSLMKERGCLDLFQAHQYYHSTSTSHNHQLLLTLHLSQRLWSNLIKTSTWTVTHLMSWM